MGRSEYGHITDDEALEAFQLLAGRGICRRSNPARDCVREADRVNSAPMDTAREPPSRDKTQMVENAFAVDADVCPPAPEKRPGLDYIGGRPDTRSAELLAP
jgi:hypothetical protein